MSDNFDIQKKFIEEGKVYLGIELGSTRIKAVLIGENFKPIVSGSYNWENKLVDGIWTYSLDSVWAGLKASYKDLTAEVNKKFEVSLNKISGLGISAMMHGYLAFDKNDNLLVPFRTWRNTTTEQAAEILSKRFNFNIPQRWSIAHLYQAILNKENHIQNVDYITTLSGYVHEKLTGKKVLGIGDASGMFPIDSTINDYDNKMVESFDELLLENGLNYNLENIFPQCLCAGDNAGILTAEGAKLLDPSGQLEHGVPMAPPEGDAGTGMVATNSVLERTGNVSAGTSIFAMIVLEHALEKTHMEIDMVTTPAGKPVAMVHCNNCTSDFDAWVNLFAEINALAGNNLQKYKLYDMLYFEALKGDANCGGLLSYNYYSGEPITGTDEGRPLFVRKPDSNFSVANFMRAHLFSAMATLKIGMDILTEGENVKVEQLLGHGGLFKTEKVGQKLMAGALNVPVSVMESAAEGGAWGIALLAAYRTGKSNLSLDEYLNKNVFKNEKVTTEMPDQSDVKGFVDYLELYKAGLSVEKSAIENLW